MNVFHFVTINLLPLTLSRLQCVLFYVCHHSVHYWNENTEWTFMDYKLLSDPVCLWYIDWTWWSKDITKNQKKMIYNSMVKSVLIYGAETWSLYEDDRRRINATEMDTLRQSARISKLDRKVNEYIREKMDVSDTILDEITRKQLSWYWHVERMDPTWLPKLWLTGNLKEGKTRPSPKNLERWDICSHEWKRTKNKRMEHPKAMEYGSRKASPDVLKSHVYILFVIIFSGKPWCHMLSDG